MQQSSSYFPLNPYTNEPLELLDDINRLLFGKLGERDPRVAEFIRTRREYIGTKELDYQFEIVGAYATALRVVLGIPSKRGLELIVDSS